MNDLRSGAQLKPRQIFVVLHISKFLLHRTTTSGVRQSHCSSFLLLCFFSLYEFTYSITLILYISEFFCDIDTPHLFPSFLAAFFHAHTNTQDDSSPVLNNLQN